MVNNKAIATNHIIVFIFTIILRIVQSLSWSYNFTLILFLNPIINEI